LSVITGSGFDLGSCLLFYVGNLSVQSPHSLLAFVFLLLKLYI